MISRDAKLQAPFPAFTGGLATGLLVSALIAAPFLFRSYKRQLGESLIQWGELISARPHSQVQSASPALPPTGSPLEQTVVSAPKEESPAPQKMSVASRLVPPAPTSLPRLRSEKLIPEQVKKTAEPQPAHDCARNIDSRDIDSDRCCCAEGFRHGCCGGDRDKSFEDSVASYSGRGRLQYCSR